MKLWILEISPIEAEVAVKVFGFTAVNDVQKAKYKVIIDKLGGRLADDCVLTKDVTHLICGKPS